MLHFISELLLVFLLLPISHEYAPRRYYETWPRSRYPDQYGPTHYHSQYPNVYTAESQNSPRWVRINPPREIDRNLEIGSSNNGEDGRHFKPETIFKITETLGALNTVGRYLVNITRNGEPNNVSPEVPSALYTISKNVLGRNVTDTLAPIVREALPVLGDNSADYTSDNRISSSNQNGIKLQEIDKIGENDDDEDPRTCTTPDGVKG